MNVGQYIKKLRLEKGLTQEEVGAFVGVQRAAVQKWESGMTQNIKRNILQKLAELFNVLPSSFIAEIVEDSDIPSPIITKDQQSLINTYEQLNGDGKQKLTDYGNDLVSSGRYNTDNDIRTYKIAARNGKDTITLTKEQREELIRISKEPSNIPDGTF